MPPPREERVARNEVSFRAFNEELIEGRGLADRPEEHVLSVVCECGDASCDVFLHAPLEVYCRVRADARCFLVLRGHDVQGVEDVLEQTERYAVVRKHDDVDPIVLRDGPAGA